MKILPYEFLICPFDNQKLDKNKISYRCTNHHTFDISKGGYVNLLAVQLKRSKNPGDSVEMVNARKRTLEAKLFQPLTERINENIKGLAMCSSVNHMSILDAGCGTGHYLDQVKTSLQALRLPKTASLIGMDISKQAVQQACKLSREITWCVASNKNIPIQSSSTQVICNFFGFPVHTEFHRVLAKNGIVISIDPGPNHLIEIRQILYSNIRYKKREEKITKGFSEYSTERYTNEVEINPEKVLDLVSMTPHFFKTSKERIQKLISDPPQKITFDYIISMNIKN